MYSTKGSAIKLTEDEIKDCIKVITRASLFKRTTEKLSVKKEDFLVMFWVY